MRYNPRTTDDDQPTDSKAIAPGVYSFEIVEAVESISQAGNEMIKLTLIIQTDSITKKVRVYDWLVNTPGGLWKVKMFCREVGLDFEAGELTPVACMHKTGTAEFHHTKQDLEAVHQRKLKHAYLKVKRYGVHEDQSADNAVPEPEPVETDEPDLPLCPSCGNFRCTCQPQADENKWGDECPF